jgi:hypothetical protein
LPHIPLIMLESTDDIVLAYPLYFQSRRPAMDMLS